MVGLSYRSEDDIPCADWLDVGLPARAKIQPPGENYIPNPKRPSNPFAPTEEPDWVKIGNIPRTASRNGLLDGGGASDTEVTQQPKSNTQRRLPPPYNPSEHPLNVAKRTQSGTAALAPTPSRSTSHSSIRSLPTTSASSATHPESPIRKPAPPVPKKPTKLSTATSPTTEAPNSTANSQRATASASASTFTSTPTSITAPFPPPPRRAATLTRLPPPPSHASAPPSRSASRSGAATPRKPAPGSEKMAAGADDVPEAAGPPLPPRRAGTAGPGSAGLLDQTDEGMEGLRDWEVLKPG